MGYHGKVWNVNFSWRFHTEKNRDNILFFKFFHLCKMSRSNCCIKADITMRMTSQKQVSKKIFSWALYDWGNSAFSAIILTFVFSIYFSKSVMGDDITGGALWGYAISASGLGIALLAPFLGAIADYGGRTRRWIGWLTLISCLATAGLFILTPDAPLMTIGIGLVCLIIAVLSLELALVFYNAQLTVIAPKDRIGRISGWGWALGYGGGLTALVLALVFLTGLGENFKPLLGVSEDNALNIRATAILVALWMGIFTLPLLFATPDLPSREADTKRAIRLGIKELWNTLKSVKKHRNIVRFLIASALYKDGLATLFALGGVYAAAVYDMALTDILVFAIGLNVTAGLGAFAFSFIDDKAGSKATIMISLIGLILSGTVALFAPDKTSFILISLCLGLFIGPTQAASRTYIARLSPPEITTQIYGLYAFSGKAIAFLGPLSYGLFIQIWDTHKAGLSSILIFWSAGLALLTLVKDKRV
ncbi:MAG: MFS transporter [Micavibrio sp.]|nr:MFS transporter [Micavibrio sp.]